MTIAGAIATATRISSFVLDSTTEGNKTVSFMCQLQLIRCPLSLVTYSCEDRDNCCYRNCLVHLGALGPVAFIRLRLVPDYRMQLYTLTYLTSWRNILNWLRAVTVSFTVGLNFGTG